MSPEQKPRFFGMGTHSTCLYVVARFLPSTDITLLAGVGTKLGYFVLRG